MKKGQIKKKKKHDSLLHRAIKFYINPFDSNPVRMYEASGFETSIYKRVESYVARSNASGSTVITLGGWDPDSPTSALSVGDASGDTTINTTNLASNTYLEKITIPNVKGKSFRVFNLYAALRVKYIGPLLDRGGVVTTITQVNGDIITDASKAGYHPHAYVKPIDDGWFYLRRKPEVV